MDVKKGLRNPLEEAQVRKAVIALQAFADKQKAALSKKPLVDSVEYVSAIITRKLIPAKGSHKPIQIAIPHSLRGGDNDAEMCLIVKNGDKDRIKAALATDPVAGLAKVMDIKKLKKNFSRFEDRRTLAGAYDLFLADDRIVPYLPEALGSKFFIKKKQPVAVRVSRKDVSNGIRAIYQRTQMVVSTGVCTNVKVAHLGMSVDEAVENILVAMNNCAAHIPKGWNGVQSISIKTSDSVALPIYNALSTLAKLPPMSKPQALQKRKLEELESSGVVKENAKAAKKAKKEEAVPAKKEEAAKKKAKKEAPVKKEEAKKETTPTKDAVSKKEQKKKDKTSTSVKAETATTSENSSNASKKRKTEVPTPEPAAKKKNAGAKSTPPQKKNTKPSKKKIRQKFTQNTSLNSYDKKKYAWKLIYIYMLGYDIDFGHMQVINLVSGTKYSEKCLGYLGCSILLKSSDELMTLAVNSIGNDLGRERVLRGTVSWCRAPAHELVQHRTRAQESRTFRSLIDVVVSKLAALVVHKACPRDYMYYNTPCPWLQVKLLRLLQQYGPLEDQGLREKLDDTLRRVLSRPTPGKGAKNNAAYAVLIETVNLVIAQGKKSDPKLKELAVQLLARFISVSEPNIRYIGLDSMYRLVRLEGDAETVKQHKDTVLFSLKDADNSVRRRALDLLFSMCDSENALEIVGELANYLAIAEGVIREEIVLKAAILAEKYAKNLRWYVDTVLQLITIAGSEVPDDVWHRVVQIVTNKEELQKYAAEVMFRALEPKHVDETTAKFGAYVLGEFGYLICDESEMTNDKQFDVLHKHYLVASIPTKCLILTAFVKMENLYDEI
ncbi:Ap-2 complex subunit alpha, partial [Globisporangium splendens]